MLSKKMKTKLKKIWCICITTVLFFSILGLTGISKAQTQEKYKLPKDININTKELISGGKISLGYCTLNAGDTFTIKLNWNGTGPVVIQCKNKNADETVQEYTIVKGKEKVYTISEKGEYSFPIINRGSDRVTELKGTIKFGSPLTIDSTTFNGKQQTTKNKKVDNTAKTNKSTNALKTDDDSPNPMEFEFSELKSGDIMEHYSYNLNSGDKYKILINWDGNKPLYVQCKKLGKKDKIVEEYKILSGVSVTYSITEEGEYSFPIVNKGKKTIRNISGSITFSK